MIKIDTSIFLDYNKIFAYNAKLYFIVTERGLGKSFGAKDYVTKHFKKTKKQFVYIRRFKTELHEALFKEKQPIFFNQIKCNYPNDELTNTKEVFKVNGQIAGYAIPLSTANILKSSTFENVDTIIFDEFLITKSTYHYLPNEIIQFAELLETIIRLRPNIKILMLGNAISITNPYFEFFGLSLPYNSQFKTFKNGLILVHYSKNEKYHEVKAKSVMGQLFAGTDYANYAFENEFLEDNTNFIHKKTPIAKFNFILNINNKKYGVWTDYKHGYMFISKDYDPKFNITFSINNNDHNEDTIFIRVRTSPFFKSLIEYYRISRLYFENQSIKNNCMKYLLKYLQ